MFKVGDKVICIDNSGASGSLEKNVTYVVTKKENENCCIQVSGFGGGWFSERFILDDKEQRKQKLNRICLK